MTPLSNYSDSIEDAMSECSPVKIAKIVIEQHKQISDQEITRLEAELQAARDNALEEAAIIAKEVEQSLGVAPRYRGWVSKKVRALKDNE